jgi:alanyl-tRNA synthetase
MLAEIGKLEASLNSSNHSEAIKTAPLKELSGLYANSSAELQAAIAAQAEANKKLAKEEAERKRQAALGDGKVTVETLSGVKFIGKAFDGLDPKDLREITNGYLKQADVVAVATVVEGKASVVVGINKTHTDKLSAVTFVQKAVEILGGKGGGGKPEMAQGGGPEGDKINEALAAIRSNLAA